MQGCSAGHGGVGMLIHFNARAQAAHALPGDAQVVVSLLADGRYFLTGYRKGEFACSQSATAADVLHKLAILNAELRQELVLGRNLTMSESASSVAMLSQLPSGATE